MDFKLIRSDNLNLLTQKELQLFVNKIIKWVKENPSVSNTKSIQREFNQIKIVCNLDSGTKKINSISFIENDFLTNRTCSKIGQNKYKEWEAIYFVKKDEDGWKIESHSSYENWVKDPHVKKSLNKEKLIKKLSIL